MTETMTSAQLLDSLSGLGWGPHHRERANHVLAVAQERGDHDLEFEVRMLLTADGAMSGIGELALTNFAWCVAKHKEDPARFVGGGEDSSDTIFWQYKWMPGIICRNSVFDLAQLEAVFEDFEQTYRAAGLPLSAIVTARMESAIKTGRLDEADRLAAQLADMPRDDYSSCEACVPSDLVDLELLRGDDAAAVDLAVATWRSGSSCGEEPESMLATVLLPMLRVGRLEEAKEAFEFSYEMSHSDEGEVVNTSSAAEFASLTGNHELALSLVERHLASLAHDALSEADQLSGALSFAVVLDRLDAQGSGDVLVRSSSDRSLEAVLPATEQPRTVSELAPLLWDFAVRTAERFDARNGNDLHAGRVAQARALVAQDFPLELDGPDGFTPFTVRAVQPATPGEWVERAVESLWAFDPQSAAEAANRAEASSDALTPLQRMRASAVASAAAERMGDDPTLALDRYVEAVAAWHGEASAALAAVTRPDTDSDTLIRAVDANPGAEPRVRARALSLAARNYLVQENGPSQEDYAAADALYTRALDALDPSGFADAAQDERDDLAHSRLAILISRVQARYGLGDAEAVFADLDAALEQAVSRPARAAALEMRSNVLNAMERTPEAADACDESASLYAASGFERAAMLRSFDGAKAWMQAGEPEAAAARFDYGISLFPPDQDLPAGLRWDYANALLEAGQADRAIPLFEQFYAGERAAGDVPPESLGVTLYRLARAYDRNYDERAGATYSEAASLFAQGGSHLSAAQASLDAGREYSYQHMFPEALAALEFGRAQVSLEPNPSIEFELLSTQARALAIAGEPGWESLMEDALVLARSFDEPMLLARALTARVGLHFDAQRHSAVVELAPQVVEELLVLGRGDEAIGALYWLATAHVALGNPAAATAVLFAYLPRRAEFGEDAQEDLCAMGSDVLEELGLEDEVDDWFDAFED